MDCAHRFGDSVIGSAATWMLRPDPSGEATIHVDVRGEAPDRMVTGLRRDPRGGYALRARELGEASYTAFGDFRRARAEVPGAALDVALLGPPLAMGDDAVVGWVRGAAGCVARLYGRFPVDATVFVLPVHGADGLVFGRVLSLAGGSVALLFGSETHASSAHQDWVAVHELFHLGTPSFVGEGHWLEEGLATYYEPVLRRRASWLRDEDLWTHFAREMPRGLRAAGSPPALEDRDDIDSTYWGGALFALVADVRIREATRGARSLDDVLRAALARLGDATHETTVAEFLRLGDEVTGTRVLEDLHARVAVAGEPVDLDALWRSLGVVRRADKGLDLVDGAPLAAIRRSIGAGDGH
jgi:predicted metalloprotease with PDZ domain